MQDKEITEKKMKKNVKLKRIVINNTPLEHSKEHNILAFITNFNDSLINIKNFVSLHY